MKLRVIMNPTAGSGSALRRLPTLKRLLEDRGIQAEIAETSAPGDATRLVHEARADGVECLAVMGGDGTLNEVSQGYLDPAGNPLPGPDIASGVAWPAKPTETRPLTVNVTFVRIRVS